MTTLRNTTGECLRLFASTSQHSYLFINIMSESGTSQQIMKFQSLTENDWSILFEVLPSGLNHILLLGVTYSGRIIVDNIEIGSCQYFYGM